MAQKRKRTTVTNVRLLVFSVLAFSAGPFLVPSAFAERCVIDVVVLNRGRHVAGDIDVECPGELHSPPFGNWGAKVAHFPDSKLQDGFQFSGWKRDGGWWQWNSCTTDYPKGDRRYYNVAPEFNAQMAWPDVENVVQSQRAYQYGDPGQTCKNISQYSLLIFGSSSGISMEVYELDPGP